MTDTQIFEPDGRAIPYAVEGNGPAVVLIAGRGLNIEYLMPLGHSVAQEDFRVVRIGSRRPATGESISMRELAQDIVDVMEYLEVADAWVGGHAFGGSIARVVSHEHHDRVNGVLLMGVESPEVSGDWDFAGVPARFRDAEVETMQASARATSVGQWEELPSGMPVLVIQGAEDQITPPAHGEALQVSAPTQVSVVSVDGGEHMFPATHIGATSWAIEDYLDWD